MAISGRNVGRESGMLCAGSTVPQAGLETDAEGVTSDSADLK
jgi:hypothetical protein